MLFDIRHSNYSNETYVYKFLSNIVDIFKLVFFVCRHLTCRMFNLYVVWGNTTSIISKNFEKINKTMLEEF